MTGWYSRPIIFNIVTSRGVCLTAMFGQNVAGKLISFGASPLIELKYIEPSVNNSKGILFIKSYIQEVSIEIFYTATYSTSDMDLSIEGSNNTEFATGTDFNG